MKNIKLLIVLLFGFISSNQVINAQVRVIDNKGTVSTIDESKWVRIGSSNNIYAKYPGNVGIGISAPVATLHNAGSTILGMTTTSNVPAAYAMPTAFVDDYSGVVITQVLSTSTITLPPPTNNTFGRLFTISNASTSAFPLSISGTTYKLMPGQSGQLMWNGITWSLPGAFDASSFSVAGDVSGTLEATTVNKLKGTDLSFTSLASGHLLRYDGTNWANWNPNFLTLTSLSATAPLTYNNTTGAFNITQATTSTNGYLSSTDWNIFNNKQATISLTTTGTSGNATFSANTLNIPNYTYTLPAATTTTLGGVKVGSGLNVSAGTISTVNNGTVTGFSAGDLGPLFTTTEATTTTTPALSFTLTNAAANTILGNNTGAAAAPSYFSATALPVAGDVSGTLGTSTVDKLKGTALSITSLASGHLLRYNGTNWANWNPNFLTLTSLSATAPLTYNNTTGAFNITQATTSTNGYLSSTDWNTFNNKVSFPGFGLTTGKVWGYDTHPTTIAGYGITDAAPISGSANYIQNQNSAAQTANMWISGNVTASQFNGSGAGLTGTAASLTAGSANFLNYNSMLTYGASGVNYFNLSGTAGNRPDNNDTPTAAWYHILRLNHSNPAGYFVDIAANLNSSGTDVYHRLVQADSGTPVSTPWFKFIDSNNIGSQRVDGAIKLWSVSHPNDYYISNTWDGTYWQLTSNHSSAVNVGHATVATRLDGPAHTNGTDGWWRSVGNAGWYNETYSTGIYSSEAGNVRTYNDASFIANNITANGQFNGSGAGLTGVAPNLQVGNATTATYINSPDGDRNPNTELPTTSPRTVRFDFADAGLCGTGGRYAGVMTYAPWDGTTGSTGDASYQLAFGGTAADGGGMPMLRIRKGIDATWTSWYTIWHEGNFSPSAYLPLAGGTMTGTLTAPTGVFTNITVNGTLTAPSDIRLKTKVETLTNVLAKLEQLRGVSYEYVDQQKYAKGLQVGVIAQELQKVFPELVKTDENGYLSVNYSQLTAILIQAIKEQQTEIDLLKTQMEKVMSKLGLK